MSRRPLEASWEKVVEQAHDLPPERAEVVIKHVAETLLDRGRWPTTTRA